MEQNRQYLAQKKRKDYSQNNTSPRKNTHTSTKSKIIQNPVNPKVVA